MGKIKTKNITITFTADEYNRISEAAKEEDRPIANFIRSRLRTFFLSQGVLTPNHKKAV